MRRFFPFLLLLLLVTLSAAQDVTWKARLEPKDARGGEAALVVIDVDLPEGTRIYGFDQTDKVSSTTIKLGDGPWSPNGDVIQAEGEFVEDPTAGETVVLYGGKKSFAIPVKLKEGAQSGQGMVTVSFQTVPNAGEQAFPAIEEEIPVRLSIEAGEARDDRLAALTEIPAVSEDPKSVTTAAGSAPLPSEASLPLFNFLLLAIGGGLAALLTPCVFPMIPVTVSFFTKRAETNPGQKISGPISYCLGIISAFVVVGVAVSAIFGGFAIQGFAAKGETNLVLGLLFVFLALNLFGVFEIQLPGWLVNNVSKGRSKGGLVGPFMMGLAFSLTSYTCTLGFVGGLLGLSAKGDLTRPILGMFFFGLTFALPFFLLALMPDAIKKLPRSGAWMTTVKAFMGFLELAAAFKFFQQADIAWEARLFTRATFLASWSVVFLVAGLFMMGWMLFPKEVGNPIGPVRRGFGIACFALTIWFFGGMAGLSLGELNGYLPPSNYHGRWETKTDDHEGWETDIDKAFALAKEKKQNVFVDFTGFNCVNCRWMEANVFPKPEVQAELDKMIKLQLYTDRAGEPYATNAKYQEKLTNTYSLPVYAIVTPEGKLISMHKDMERDLNKYLDFLKKGSGN